MRSAECGVTGNSDATAGEGAPTVFAAAPSPCRLFAPSPSLPIASSPCRPFALSLPRPVATSALGSAHTAAIRSTARIAAFKNRASPFCCREQPCSAATASCVSPRSTCRS